MSETQRATRPLVPIGPQTGNGHTVVVAEPMTEAALARAELAIERGARAFVEVSMALLAIRDGRGYRLRGYETFERYVAERWGWTRQRAYQLVEAAETARELADHGRHLDLADVLRALGTERFVREVRALPAEMRRELAEAVQRGMTPRELRAQVREFRTRESELRRKPKPALRAPVTPIATWDLLHWPDGEPIPWDDGACDVILSSPPFALDVPYADGGDVPSYTAYRELMPGWAAELLRVCNPDHGRLLLHVPLDRTQGGRASVYTHWTGALEQAGWTYQTTILVGDGTMSHATAWGSIGTPSVMAPYEALICMYRGGWRRTDREPDLTGPELRQWAGPNGAWLDIRGEDDPEHPAVFDKRFVYRALKLHSMPGDTVGDPWCGRGTVPLISRLMGRHPLACDRSPTYVRLAHHNLETGELGGRVVNIAELARSAMIGDVGGDE